MALTGMQIFKYMPKTNCGQCGVPTCLAFAMKLASSGPAEASFTGDGLSVRLAIRKASPPGQGRRPWSGPQRCRQTPPQIG